MSDQSMIMAYDFESELESSDYPGGTFDTFKYNGLGLRVQKVDSAGTQNYLTDGAEPASPVIADSGATYTPGISERRGGISKFYHGDHLGSTRGITNSAQTATDSMLHDAFSGLVSRTGTTPTPFGFVGQEQYQTDSDSGLMLLGHRYYDPYTGRFITQDPIGDDRNWYGYVANDPLSYIDPKGLREAPSKGETAQIYSAINFIRKSRFKDAGKIADDLKAMFANRQIHVEEYSDPYVRGETPIYFYTTRKNVTINLDRDQFASNFSDLKPLARFINDANLAATLIHEYVHARTQGFFWSKFHPNEKEDRAYGAELRYYRSLIGQFIGDKNKRGGIEGLIEKNIGGR